MHRTGHRGIVFLVLAAVQWILFSRGQPFLAIVACGAYWIEPLPDFDLRTSLLTHRKTSHSLFAASVVGGCCAGLGWCLGTYVTTPVLPWLRSEVLIGSQWPTWMATHLDLLSAEQLALLGFCVGAGGIVIHLLGDVITVSGIQPLLPFFRWKLKFSPIRAGDPLVNNLLSVLGVGAIVAVWVTKTPIETMLLAMLGLG